MPEEKVVAESVDAAVVKPATVRPWNRNVIILLCVGLVAMAIMLWRVETELTALTHTLSQISEDVRSSRPVKPEGEGPETIKGEAMIVATKTVKTNDGLITFTQRCEGKMDVGEASDTPYCVGDNQLTITREGEKPMLLDHMNATDAAGAPVFAEATYIASATGAGAVLLSYGPNACETTTTCDDGEIANTPEHHVTFAYGLSENKLAALKNYPAKGWLTWHSSGTKALVIPETRVVANCEAKPLNGYDLNTDTLKDISEQTGAGMVGNGDTKDAAGKKLPKWIGVEWTDGANFSANLRDVNGKTIVVTGTF